jgi:V/A-type H+/Na+-transporting ATPase subunit E
MDVQLKDLIEKIKSEGVKTAEEEAKKIIEAAKKEAEEIVSTARKEVIKLKSDAESEIDRSRQSGSDALKQAGRDLLINLRKKIIELFDAVIKTESEAVLGGLKLEDAILAIIKNWDQKKISTIEVLVESDGLSKIQDQLKSKLAAELQQGLEIKPFSGIDSGFKIAEKDGSAYYNFTGAGIAEVLSELLNPQLSKILEESAKEE